MFYVNINCEFDGDYFLRFMKNYPKCNVDEPNRINNEECDEEYDTAECGWYGGDSVEFH